MMPAPELLQSRVVTDRVNLMFEDLLLVLVGDGGNVMLLRVELLQVDCGYEKRLVSAIINESQR